MWLRKTHYTGMVLPGTAPPHRCHIAFRMCFGFAFTLGLRAAAFGWLFALLLPLPLAHDVLSWRAARRAWAAFIRLFVCILMDRLTVEWTTAFLTQP
jgi:hypothetical protein